MTRKLSVRELYDKLEHTLRLDWIAARHADSREIQARDSERPSLAGFLNLIHPNTVQVMGLEEMRFLDGLDAKRRWETLAECWTAEPAALVVANDQHIPNDLSEGAEEAEIPLWTSPRPATEVVSRLQHELSLHLARSMTVHGVFMEIFTIGVLITGDSGSGKSELALELISRGHRLVADDAPLLTLIGPDTIDGTCPELLQDCLEVRGLGILNVRAMFGDSAVKRNKYLRLIIHLELAERDRQSSAETDRLRGNLSERRLLDIGVPCITVPVAPGRNIAVIVEAAVRNHALKLKGFDAAESFLARHQQQLFSS